VLTLALAAAGPLGVAALVSAARRANAAERARILGGRPPRRLPIRVRAPLARALAAADLSIDPEAAVELWAAGVGAVCLLATALAPGLALPAALLAIASGPATLVLLRGRRDLKIAAALPGALEQLAAELRGGGTVAEGVARLADGDGPLAGDLRRVHTRASLGVGLADALAAWPGERPRLPEIRAVAGALAVAVTLGGRSAGALEGLSASLRDRLGAVAESRSLSAQTRLSAVVVGAAPLGYLAFSALVDPRSLGVLVGTGVGRVCLVVGLALEGLAALWMRRIVRSTA